MEISFKSKRALVTGAERGIGKEIAKQLVKCGAEVVALSLNKEPLEQLAREVNVTTIAVDLSDWDKTREAVKSAGPIDLLVNNAGVVSLNPFLDIKPEEFDSTFAVNVKPIINVSQVVVEGMVKRKTGGSIVNISSQASQAALLNHTVYCASKAAVDQITKVMAVELGPHNIRVNTVNPTVVLTEMGRFAWRDPEKASKMLSEIPLGKFAEVEDIVNAVLFLLSDKAAMVNGITLPVDGGFLAR
ncbi:L-xylulose reductase-like [Schistocerca serialis cubense]|uniref:L-xylulose reductase-like n=1 Tax=Schistocerca serialis cubense TaxID=2023355 RepID=UPI00214E4357|nr:L-xylulose reductase-like [Schistocerca serialis cubense]